MVGISRDEVHRRVRRTVQLITEGFAERPALDAAVSRALLDEAAAGTVGETFRLSVPGRSVQFGRMDTRRPGFDAAVTAARNLGFAPVVRLAGGRAAVFHEHTLAFAWIVPERRRARSIEERFAEVSSLITDALTSMGIDARVGEVPGEYCPGGHSVNMGGVKKVMGVGQRLVRGASHLGGVVVVDGAHLVNEVLDPVYRHLGYDWDPEATGAVADAAEVDVSDVQAAIATALADRHRVVLAGIAAGIRDAAERTTATDDRR
jgi:lipoate-protein ligase A